MSSQAQHSPRVTTIGWGKMKIESLGSGKDFKLWPGGGRQWDWKETGTTHSPGVQVADVEELLNHDCQVIVLTRGIFSRLKITTEVIGFLEEHGIEVVVADTKRGVKLYNDYVDKDVRVGGLFHSTC